MDNQNPKFFFEESDQLLNPPFNYFDVNSISHQLRLQGPSQSHFDRTIQMISQSHMNQKSLSTEIKPPSLPFITHQNIFPQETQANRSKEENMVMEIESPQDNQEEDEENNSNDFSSDEKEEGQERIINPWKNQCKKYNTALQKALSPQNRRTLRRLESKLKKLRKKCVVFPSEGPKRYNKKKKKDIRGSWYGFTCKLIEIALLLGRDDFLSCYSRYREIVPMVTISKLNPIINSLHENYRVYYQKSFKEFIEGNIVDSVNILYDINPANFKQKKYKNQGIQFVIRYYKQVNSLQQKLNQPKK